MKNRTPTAFIADAQLGRLARHLHFGGFDTLYLRERRLDELRQLSLTSGRILLTRSRRIAKSEEPLFFHLSSERTEEQLRELAAALPLRETFRPFSRCMLCNTPLEKTGKGELAGDVPAKVLHREELFCRCPDCGRVYWRGPLLADDRQRKRILETAK